MSTAAMREACLVRVFRVGEVLRAPCQVSLTQAAHEFGRDAENRIITSRPGPWSQKEFYFGWPVDGVG